MDASTRVAINSLADQFGQQPTGDSGLTIVGMIASLPLPDRVDRFWPFHPVRVEGVENTGNAAVFYTDARNTLYAVLIGDGRLPIVGEKFLFHNVNGYWVFETHGQPPL